MIKTSVYRPILMLMVLTTFVVFGFYTFRLTGINMMPDIDIPYVTVQIVYPGAGPTEIESSVIEKLEDPLSLIDGIDEVMAVSGEGFCIFTLKFNMGTDINVAATDVKDKIDATLSDLPSEIEDPIVSKLDIGDKPIVNLALLGPGSEVELRRFAEDVVKVSLAQVSGVASVEISGGKEREIQVEVRKADLEAHQLTFDDLIAMIQGNNLNYPLGNLKLSRTEMNIRLNAEFANVDSLKQLIIPTQTGMVRLGDIAQISDTYKEVTKMARYNRTAAIGLDIKKRSDANIIETAQNIRKRLNKIRENLPPGYKLEVANDNSIYIQNSVNDVYNNIGLGIFFTAIVLLIFLRNWRSTIIAAVTMPISVISTFTFIYASGFTLNFMSLMALGISVGLLVTNAIVVIENIIVHLKHAEGPKEAAVKGTSEIMVAVMASTLTNVAVFVPIAFMQSIVGQFFKEFGMTMVYATFVSLLISFTLTPLMAAYLFKKGEINEKDDSKGFFNSLRNGYAKLLEHSLTIKGAVILVLVVLAIFVSLVPVGGQLGGEFVPKTDEGTFNISFELPAGTRIEETNKLAAEIERRVAEIPEVASQYLTVGGDAGNIFGGVSGPHGGKIVVQLKHMDQRERSVFEIASEFRPKLADLPDALIRITPVSSAGGDAGSADLEIQIRGDIMDSLLVADSIVRDILRETPGAVDIQSSWKQGKPEFVLRPIRGAIADFYMAASQVAATLRGYIYGTEAGVLREHGEETDITVKLAASDRENTTDLLAMTMSSPRGYIPISSIVKAQQESGPSTITRKEKQRMITVSANLLPGFSLGTVQAIVQNKLAEKKTSPEVNIAFGGDSEFMAEAMVDFAIAILMAILLTYILLTAILESFWQPVLIMLTIPLGAIGVIYSLFLTAQTISIISLMAMVMLIGVVVNNAILILDQSNQYMRKGHDNLRTALIHAGRDKFQAIVMTNIAALFSMLPLAMGLGEGAEMRQPMGIASVGGLLVSTTFTIFLIPTMVWLSDRMKDRFLKLIGKAKA